MAQKRGPGTARPPIITRVSLSLLIDVEPELGQFQTVVVIKPDPIDEVRVEKGDISGEGLAVDIKGDILKRCQLLRHVGKRTLPMGGEGNNVLSGITDQSPSVIGCAKSHRRMSARMAERSEPYRVVE